MLSRDVGACTHTDGDPFNSACEGRTYVACRDHDSHAHELASVLDGPRLMTYAHREVLALEISLDH